MLHIRMIMAILISDINFFYLLNAGMKCTSNNNTTLPYIITGIYSDLFYACMSLSCAQTVIFFLTYSVNHVYWYITLMQHAVNAMDCSHAILVYIWSCHARVGYICSSHACKSRIYLQQSYKSRIHWQQSCMQESDIFVAVMQESDTFVAVMQR